MASLPAAERFQKDFPPELQRELARYGIFSEVSDIRALRQERAYSDVMIRTVVKCENLYTTLRFEYFGYTRDRDWRFYEGIEYRYTDGKCVFRVIGKDGRYRQGEVLENGLGNIPARLRAMRGTVHYYLDSPFEGGPSPSGNCSL